MNKRIKNKKQKEFLITAILELNNDVAWFENLPPITRDKAEEVYRKKIKNNQTAIKKVTEDYQLLKG